MAGPIAALIIIVAVALILLETSKGSMAGNLAFPDLLALAQGAGFTSPDDVTAAAIALAESGGDPNAYNPETAAGAPAGMGSYGLWQIYREAHPEFAVENLYDPKTNASAAFTTYMEAGGSFNPWSTFKSQAYLSRIPAGYSA